MFRNANVHLRSGNFFKGGIGYEIAFLIKMKPRGPHIGSTMN